MPTHAGAALIGLLTFLLVALAVAVNYGYLASATVAGLTATGLGALAALAMGAAVGVYVLEDRYGSDGYRYRGR
jgi:hypothetical protein